ncbi:MAG: glycoside hydrolase family 55 protein [Rhizonema sp. NSF051]|nr:glycoside hydrolase family 55 protein [Rhizonema sp. NSF051]
MIGYDASLVDPASKNIVYPSDSGIKNVKTDFGAIGDGTTDDTAAIQAGVTAVAGTHITLYFPAGTYLVSNTIVGKDSSGNWRRGIVLQGQNQSSTTIKLKNNASGFTNASSPQAVYVTGSDNPYSSQGEGNQAFNHSVRNLTFDIGSGNAGASAISYLANNQGSIENCVFKSSDSNYAGYAGISIERGHPGPCLIKSVAIVGFNYGIYFKDTVNGIMLENVATNNQVVYGMYCPDPQNVIVRKWTSNNNVPAFNGTECALTIIDSVLNGGSNTSNVEAIQNEYNTQYTNGFGYIRNVQSTGYRKLYRENQKNIETPGTSVNSLEFCTYQTKSQGFSPTLSRGLNLSIQETPIVDAFNYASANWQFVGAPSGGDDTSLIQSALNSGKAVVYFKSGNFYRLDSKLTIPASVKVILGLGASIVVQSTNTAFKDANNPNAMFNVLTGNDLLVIRELDASVFPGQNASTQAGAQFLLNQSQRSLLVKQTSSGGGALVTQKNNGVHAGDTYLEDYPGTLILNGGKCWGRQFNPENANNPFVLNNGGELWLFGMKAEGVNTVISTTNKGATELIGCLIYPASGIASTTPCFNIVDSQMSFVGCSTSNNQYALVVSETQQGTTQNLNLSSCPMRQAGFGMLYLSRKIPVTKFSYGMEQDQTISGNTYQNVNFNAPYEDSDFQLSNGVFTCQIAGDYSFNASIYVEPSTTGTFFLAQFKKTIALLNNQIQYWRGGQIVTGSGQGYCVNCVDFINMKVGDTLSVQIFSGSGGVLKTSQSYSGYILNRFAGFLVDAA